MAALFLHTHLADPDADFFFTRDVVDDAEFRGDHRNAKRRRVENLSRRYLQGHPLGIQSARLRGPFRHCTSTNVAEKATGKSHEVPQRRAAPKQKVEKLLQKHCSDHGTPSLSPRQVTPAVAAASDNKEATREWLRRLEPRAESPVADGDISMLEDRLDGLESHTPSKPSHPRSIEKNPSVNHVLGANGLKLCWNLKEKKKDTRGFASDSLLDLYEADGAGKARSNSQPTLAGIPPSLQANVDEDSVRRIPDVEDSNDQIESDVRMLDQTQESPRRAASPSKKASHDAGPTEPKSERAPLTSRSVAFTIPSPARKTNVIKVAEGQENVPYDGETPKEAPGRPQGVRRLSEPSRKIDKKNRNHTLHASPTVLYSPFVYRKPSDEGKPRVFVAKREKRRAATARSVKFGSSPLRVDDRAQSDRGLQSPSKSEPIVEEYISLKPKATDAGQERLPRRRILKEPEGHCVVDDNQSQENIPTDPKTNGVSHETLPQEDIADGYKTMDGAHKSLTRKNLSDGLEANHVAHETLPQEGFDDEHKAKSVAQTIPPQENLPDRPMANDTDPDNVPKENLPHRPDIAHKSLPPEQTADRHKTTDVAHETLPQKHTAHRRKTTDEAHENVPQEHLSDCPQANGVAHESPLQRTTLGGPEAILMAHDILSQEVIPDRPVVIDLTQDSPPPDFSTQAALVSAQRAFQQQLVSPAKKSDIYNLMEPMLGSQNTTPPPTGPFPTFSPITPFRTVNRDPKSTQKPPASAAPPVSTQDLFNAASPFAFSTVKKAKPRKRVSIIHSLLNPQPGSPDQSTPSTSCRPAANAYADGDTTFADPSTMFPPVESHLVLASTPGVSPSRAHSLTRQGTPSWTPINKPSASQPTPSASASASVSPVLYHHHHRRRIQPSSLPPSSTAPPTAFHFSQPATQASNHPLSAPSSSPRKRRQKRRRTDSSTLAPASGHAGFAARLPDAQQVSGALLGDDEELDVDAVVEAADSFLSTWDWRRDLAGVRAV
ncbi:uncharacterized protein J3D65DRAFT_626249 [Phyllosticta citribraziliensis]|uniref:Uncharacterized protein n=1 Tax=Phyllosticta citribraziliensis TaxID=989973 RepID=A0ABR1LM58_9PEZI